MQSLSNDLAKSTCFLAGADVEMGAGNSMSAHGLRLMRMASSSQVLNADLDASDEAGCGAQCEIA